jgi:hypothetical protein
MLFLRNKKYAERTIAHLYEVMVRRNVMIKTNCRNKQHKTHNNLFEWLKIGTSNITLNLLMGESKYNVCDEN